ncbi:MAG: TerB family tellurite resistance protein [Chitinophagales bacterium]|nr:TerB family tellurite resistance protein [Chitinophagales bacterium]
MKCLLITICILITMVGRAQSPEAQQLLLNWEKLAQFKTILKNMQDGWKALDKGYTAIKDISSGNFKLHQDFLNNLLQVSPLVQKYKRVGDIIQYQLLILKQYKKALQEFRTDGIFESQELEYIAQVYTNLVGEVAKNLDELMMVITSGKLRMSDEERLQAIDRIYASVQDQFSFLQDFNSSTAYLSLQRKAEKTELDYSRRLRGIQ